MAGLVKYTVKTFGEKMDAFIAHCETGGIDATDYQLIKFFGISPDLLEEYKAENKLNKDSKYKHSGFAASLKKLDLYREDATIRQAVSDPKLLSHCALKLRQPHWGGWNDKSDSAVRDVRLRVDLGDGDKDLME